MCKVSIIVPVYNVEKYLRECLDSLVAQTLDDYEVICVNDGSNDNSYKIMESYREKNRSIKIVNHNENKGLSAARNTGIRNASGKYLLFVDSDDYILPETCECLFEQATRTESDVVFYNLSFLNDYKNGCIREEPVYKAYDGVFTGMDLFGMYQKDKCMKVESVRQFLRRSFVLENELYFYEGIIHEDMLFYFMICAKAERATDLNRSLYIYRQRADSINWAKRENSADSLIRCIHSIYAYWLHDDEFSSSENGYIKTYLESLYRTYLYRKPYSISNRYQESDEALITELTKTVNYRNVKFAKNELKKIQSSDCIVLYGAGMVAADVSDAISKLDCSVDRVVITDSPKYKYFNGIEIVKFEKNLFPKDTLFVIAVDKKHHYEIIERLRKNGYQNYVCPTVLD